MARSHTIAVLQALFVTFLWSSSWVLIKFGLEEIPALTFAGLRYGLAFLILAPFVFGARELRNSLIGLSTAGWLRLIALGLLFYTLTQGAQFVGLVYLPAVTVSLLLSFTPALVALMGIFLLSEAPTRMQWVGTAIYLTGACLYLLPVEIPLAAAGLAAAVIGLLANAGSSILGRSVNREEHLHPLVVTVVSMGIGALVLLAVGLTSQGLPSLSWKSWGLIVWLAAVNTALAFTLWNHTLRRLTAVESSLINNTMLIQIALLAWVFLDEPLSAKGMTGIVVAAVGVLLVQLARSKSPAGPRQESR
ncbi:MAG: DMT family transporter [Thermoanaerobaculia bacterium]